VQAEMQAPPADALRIEGGLALGLGSATAGAGTTQVVLQFDAWELQDIMQFVVVDVSGVESPGVVGAIFGVVCACAAPLVAVATMARMIAKVLMVASPDSASFSHTPKPKDLVADKEKFEGQTTNSGCASLVTKTAPASGRHPCEGRQVATQPSAAIVSMIGSSAFSVAALPAAMASVAR
jgi:hypothetical protein